MITALVERDLDVIASRAGRASAPRQLPFPVRTGGLGGVDGLVDALRARAIDVLVDATHAFADEMPAHARDTTAIAGVAHVRLVGPAWTAAEGERWTEVADRCCSVTSPLAAGSALVVYGRSTSTGMIAYQSTLQTLVLAEVRGRAFAFSDVLWNAARLVSLAVGGVFRVTSSGSLAPALPHLALFRSQTVPQSDTRQGER